MSIGIHLNDEDHRKLSALCKEDTRKPAGMVKRLIHVAYVELMNKKKGAKS